MRSGYQLYFCAKSVEKKCRTKCPSTLTLSSEHIAKTTLVAVFILYYQNRIYN